MGNKRKINSVDTNKPVCPYCGLVYAEYYIAGTLECVKCGLEFEIFRHI